jgi:predicted AAA+ superfamily ATPase
MLYRDRVVDGELGERLVAAGAVLIEGPKACGKTETALRVAKSSVMLDIDMQAKQALTVDPSLVLEGSTPRLIDEWQESPSIWNEVRRMVDLRKTLGQFILTGSSVPNDEPNRHSGAGRFSILTMRPMTLFEMGYSAGLVSLARLMEGESPKSGPRELSLENLADLIVRGGWPRHLELTSRAAARSVRDYLDNICHVDVQRIAGGHRDPGRLERLLRSLARNVATEVAIDVLGSDAGGESGPLAHNTVVDYLDALERLMVIENQPAWSPHLRSRTTLRRSPKRHFVDPSLAVAALGATAERLARDFEALGLLFESLVVRDLRVLSQPLDGEVFHYRDKGGQEVDAIVQLRDGRWAAFEVKLGAGRIDEGAASLLRFAGKIDSVLTGAPSMLGVITPGGYGYMRADGVAVIPMTALGP